MSAVYFMSDLHLGHNNVIKFRNEFNTIEEHDDYIEQQYKKTVTKRDKVYMLGDVAFTKETLQRIKGWVGYKVCILGNHDCERNGVTLQDYLEVFDEIHGFIKYKNYWLSHCPISEVELRGKYSVHGHVHSNTLEDPRYLNVSMEAINYTPIELQQINKIFKEREENGNIK